MNVNTDNPCYIDLHLHLDGSISVQTARHLAVVQGIAVPDDDETLASMMMLTPQCESLDDYLSRFEFACSLLHTKEALRIAAHDLLARLKSQGVIYAEVRFAPQKSCGKGLTQSDAVEAVVEGMKSVDMPSGLIVSMMREEDNEAANIETIRIAEQYLGRGVVGLDLAGAEAGFPTETFSLLFALAREKAIPFTIHCGEGSGAGNVAPAIAFGAKRVGHGVRSLEDPEVVRQLVNNDVTLELCPTSNIDTRIFPSYEEFPLRRLMQQGVKVTLNTDDMTVSDVTIADEWKHMCETFNLTRAEVRGMLLNSVEASFADDATKENLRKQIWEAYPRVYVEEISDIDEQQLEPLLGALPEWRREKALKYKHMQGRKECAVSYLLLQRALREEFGLADKIMFDYNEHGKPSLLGHEDICFNISHCKKAVAVVVGTRPVGIDIEVTGRYSDSVARYSMSEREMEAIRNSGSSDETFTELWTRKEALLKLVGTGICDNMKTVLEANKDKKITTTVCDGYIYSVAID